MKKSVLLLIIFCIAFLGSICANADFAGILNGKQDYLVLGTVKDVTESTITVSVDNVVQGSAGLKNTDIHIKRFVYSYCDEHTPTDFNKPKLGDNVFASVDTDGDDYKIRGGCYKVNSSEGKNASVIVYADQNGKDCMYELVELSYFIRTGGKINNFKKKGMEVYAISDDEEILIYPLPENTGISFVDEEGKTVLGEIKQDVLPIAPNGNALAHKNDSRWIAASIVICVGLVIGFLIFYFAYARKRL